MLGFRFAPRIRDLKDTKLYILKNKQDYPALDTMIGVILNIKHIRLNKVKRGTLWPELYSLIGWVKFATVALNNNVTEPMD